MPEHFAVMLVNFERYQTHTKRSRTYQDDVFRIEVEMAAAHGGNEQDVLPYYPRFPTSGS
jgi:DNA topoisomerase VI subunit B